MLATNASRKIPAVRFFEVSKRFVAKSLPLTEQPDEIPVLCLGLYGEGEDFFTLKGVLENLFAAFGVQADYAVAAEPYLHPGARLLPAPATLFWPPSARCIPTWPPNMG